MLSPYSPRTARAYILANRISDAMDRWPTGYMALQRLRHRSRAAHRLVSPDHRLVLEAFPRSGSSFAHRAFVAVNPDCAQSVATHIHRSAQIIAGARYGVPVLVLVRHPEDAVTSLLALGQQSGSLPKLEGVKLNGVLAETLWRYAHFHQRLLPVERMVVASFEDVTADFGAVLDRVNTTFDTGFTCFDHTFENEAAIFAKTRKHLSPNTDRDLIKTRLAKAYKDPELTVPRKAAEGAYSLISTRFEKT